MEILNVNIDLIGISTTALLEIPSIKELTLKRNENENTELWRLRRECIEQIINEIGQKAASEPSIIQEYDSKEFALKKQLLPLEQTDPYFVFCKALWRVITSMPIGFCWRMKDVVLKERLNLMDQKIQQAFETLESLRTEIKSGLKAIETPLPSMTPYQPVLEVKQSLYLNKIKVVLLTEHEVDQLIKDVGNRINYQERDTQAPSYLIIEQANDGSVSYLQKNRADYKENAGFFTQKKKELEKRKKSLEKTHQVVKQDLCQLGKAIKGSAFVFSDPLIVPPDQPPREFSSVSLLEMKDEEILKVEAIFNRLLQITKRLERPHIRIDGPIPCPEQDPLGFVLRVVQDWTPCLNNTVADELVKLKEDKTQLQKDIIQFKKIIDLYIENLHRLISEINQKQEDENLFLEDYSKYTLQHTTIVQKYDNLIDTAEKRIAKKKIKPTGPSQETYQVTALAHDSSLKLIQKNVSDLLDTQELEQMKTAIEAIYKDLNTSFSIFTNLFWIYQGMKGSTPESWTRWSYVQYYNYWYPPVQKQSELNGWLSVNHGSEGEEK